METYNLKDLPVGTKVVFDDGAKGIVKKAHRLKKYRKDGKSIWLTYFPSGDKWGKWAGGYLYEPIVKATKPKKRGSK
jgi:hypothetical protein